MLRNLLRMLAPPRVMTQVVRRRAVKIGPDGVVPSRTAEEDAVLLQHAVGLRHLLRRKQIIYWAVVTLMLVVIVAWTAHAQKPTSKVLEWFCDAQEGCPPGKLRWKTIRRSEPPKPSFTIDAGNVANLSTDTAVLYVAKDGTVMFSGSGIFDGKDSVATNLHCDPRKEGDLSWPWHHCKAEPITKCPAKD